MTCEQTQELIGAYTDDDLATEVKSRLEAHLLRCQTCAWEAQTLRITRERLRTGRGEVVASDAFRARVLSRLRHDNQHLSLPAEPEEANATQYRLPIAD